MTGTSNDVAARIRSVSAPVHGRVIAADDAIVVTLDRRSHERLAGQAPLAGIGAFAKGSLESRWTTWNLPALAAVDRGRIYAYSRGGVVVALDLDGHERWRTAIPDDRSSNGQARGDRDGPFLADVVTVGPSIYLAAGPEILHLARDTGHIVARAVVCRPTRGVVSRLVQTGDDGIVATCTERTGWDDEQYDEGSPLQRRPSLESHRTASGDLVALDFQLKERWRLPPPIAGLVYGHNRPAALDNGSVACVAARVTETNGAPGLDLFGGWIFAVDARAGTVQWRRETTSSVGQPDPVAVPGGVVAGVDTVLYGLPGGTPRWTVRRDQHGLDVTVTALFDRDRLLVVGRRGVQSISAQEGLIEDVVSLGPQAFNGLVVTPLMIEGAILYVGLEDEGMRRLIAVQLPR